MIHDLIQQRLDFSFLFSVFFVSFFSSQTPQTLTLHGYLLEKAIWCRGSSPRRVASLGLKKFHGLGELDASLSEFRVRKL